MPFDYVIYADQRLVVSTASGRVTIDEIKAHQDQLLSDPKFDTNFRQLIDGRAATALELTMEQARVLASRRIFSPKSRRALLATNPAIFGMSRVFATYYELETESSEISVFYDLRSALAWLEVEPSAIDSG